MRSHVLAGTLSLCVLAVLTLGRPSLLRADADSFDTWCPLPAPEAGQILYRLLTGWGFEVIRVPRDDAVIRLRASKGGEQVRVVVTPSSPLASRVVATFTPEGSGDRREIRFLWKQVESHCRAAQTQWNGGQGQMPEELRSCHDSVVCIRAGAGTMTIRSSGFAVGNGTFVVSTAHDFEGADEVSVVMPGGREVRGRPVKRDLARDLMLISGDFALDRVVSLAMARGSVKTGEKVFAVGCSGDHSPTVTWGIIDSPHMKSNNLPLIQAEMETLPGSSGSPVFDGKGNLVGIVKGRFRGTDSVGFLIPPETIRDFLREYGVRERR